MGKISVYDNIVIKNRGKKRKYVEIKRNVYINLHLKDGLRMEFSADIICRM